MPFNQIYPSFNYISYNIKEIKSNISNIKPITGYQNIYARSLYTNIDHDE